MSGIDQYTKSLLHFNGNLKDEADQHYWSENGVGFDSSIKKFGDYSLCFDGSSHAYIQALINSNFNFGTSDFTIEWWEYRLDTNDGRPIICMESSPTDGSSYDATFATWHDGSAPRLYMSSNSSSWDIANDANLGNNLSGQWVHRAIVRSGNTFYLFENGIIITTFTSSSSLYYNSAYYLVLGGRNSTYFKGFIDEVRISNIARWTATFTPSTEAYSLDSNTLALLHFNNDLTDEAGLLTWEKPTSIIQYSDTITKFGNKSLYLANNGSYIYKFVNSNFNFGTQDITIDWWEYLLDTNHNPILCIQSDNISAGNRNASILAGWNQNSNRWDLMASGTSEWDISGEGDNAHMGDILSGQWVHRAITRKNGTFYYFQNGQLYRSFSSSSSFYWNSNYFITLGCRSGNYLNGYVAEFRISVGTARWTEAFTPPTEAYSPDNITQELSFDTHQEIKASEDLNFDTIRINCKQSINFDAHRSIIATETHNYDTSRKLIALVFRTLDTERKIEASDHLNCDSLISIIASQHQSFDTNINSIVDQSLNFDTSRTLTKEHISIAFNCDTERNIKASLNIKNDTERNIKASLKQDYDTKRLINASGLQNFDAQINVKASQLLTFDTSRSVTSTVATSYEFDTVRNIIASEQGNFDTDRSVAIKEYSSFTTERNIKESLNLNFDTLRRLSIDIKESFDTSRKIIASQGLNFDTLRSMIIVDIAYFDTFRTIPTIVDDIYAKIISLSLFLNEKILADSFQMVIEDTDIKPNDILKGSLLDFNFNLYKVGSTKKRTSQVQVTGTYDKDNIQYLQVYANSIENMKVTGLFSIERLFDLPVKCYFDSFTYAPSITGMVTFSDMINQLFGWSTRVPTLQINAFIRSDGIYILQRGYELQTIDITNVAHDRPEIEQDLVKTIWSYDSNNKNAGAQSTDTSVDGFTGTISFDDCSRSYIDGLLQSEVKGTETTEYQYTSYDGVNMYIDTKVMTDTKTKKTVTTEYSYLPTLDGSDVYLYKEEETTVDKSGSSSTTSVKDTLHYPLGNGKYGQRVYVDDVYQGSEQTDGRPGNKVSKFVADQMNSSLGRTESVSKKDTNRPNYYFIGTNGFPFPKWDYSDLNRINQAYAWLNNSIKETVTMSIWQYSHVIDFADKIIYDGNSYYLSSNRITRTPKEIRQDLVLIRWFK